MGALHGYRQAVYRKLLNSARSAGPPWLKIILKKFYPHKNGRHNSQNTHAITCSYTTKLTPFAVKTAAWCTGFLRFKTSFFRGKRHATIL